jgi:hypothetical protein
MGAEGVSDLDRLRTLAKFVRNQACLTDEKSPKPGPGEVRLNNEAALLMADVLDEHIRQLAAAQNPRWSYSALADFFRKHGFISKSMPTCLLCRHTPISWPPPFQHQELPNIVVCDSCLENRS